MYNILRPAVNIYTLDHHVPFILNKAVIDRRLRPRCCHLESYFKRPKSSHVRPLPATVVLLRTVYSQAQGCVCTALQKSLRIPKPHNLLPHLNTDSCNLSGTDLPTLSCKRGRLTGAVVVVVVCSSTFGPTLLKIYDVSRKGPP